MNLRGISFPLEILGGIDTPLRTNGVRSLDGYDGEEIDLDPFFGDLNRRHQSRQASANHNDLWAAHEFQVGKLSAE